MNTEYTDTHTYIRTQTHTATHTDTDTNRYTHYIHTHTHTHTTNISYSEFQIESFKYSHILFLPPDPNLQIPVTWPLGTYGLPMPTSGCPKSPSFAWHSGFRYHDTSNWQSSNAWSNPYSLAGYKGKDNMVQGFCIKTQAQGTVYDMSWPRGQYCVFKKGACPTGLLKTSFTSDSRTSAENKCKSKSSYFTAKTVLTQGKNSSKRKLKDQNFSFFLLLCFLQYFSRENGA